MRGRYLVALACVFVVTMSMTLSFAVFVGQLVAGDPPSPCQKPNPNTVFCKDKGAFDVSSCAGLSSSYCHLFKQMERKQFPDGAVSSAVGTTKEEEADCYRRRHYCTWDDDLEECIAGSDWGPWFREDKTVVGDNPCPDS